MNYMAVKLLLWAIIGLVASSPLTIISSNNLGAKQCTWGPSFWCGNFTNARQCGAVKHCIQSVWEHQKVKEDNDSVCQICVKMVKEARDQLESNQTQDDLRAVFEGSCQLIHIKPIVKDCIKVVDDFIPELIEALASQMNPQIVCSVAGLCNSERIDKMLAQASGESVEVSKSLSCSNCYMVVSDLENKFKSKNADDIMISMLQICRDMGSFSDACSNLLLKHFSGIYEHFENHFNSPNVCHVAGVCADKYHTHEKNKNIEITPLSAVGFVDVEDDIPCDLCKQLVHHLRDILIANTTESEFKYVMEGLCNQTKGFKSECLSLVDQYYDKIYDFLVNNIDDADVCFLAGICPKGSLNASNQAPIWPLISLEISEQVENSDKHTEAHRKKLLGSNEPKFTAEEIHAMQLPVSRLFVPSYIGIDNSHPELCTFCEYFLHFVQETITSPTNEESIKQAIERVCLKLPNGVQAQCRAFVDTYGDAFIAIFVQELDPSQICPKLSLCPNKEVEVFEQDSRDKPTCPMCLMAMFELEEKLKEDKTKAAVEQALSGLCNHLSEHLKPACITLVNTYYNQLVEMLMADFKPQEICVFLRLCHDKNPDLSGLDILVPAPINKTHDIMTNEILDTTINGQTIQVAVQSNLIPEKFSDKPQCIMCEFIMKQLEDELKDKRTEEDIIKIVNNVCKAMPRNVKPECIQFVHKYGDLVIQLLIQALQPNEICSMLGLCNS